MFKISFDFHMSIRKKDNRLQTETGAVRLSTFADGEALLMKKSRSVSTRNNYRTAIASIIMFAGNGVTLADLTADLTEAYQAWLRSRGICLNTVSCYMRSLRAIYNRAVEAGIVADARPFRHVFTGKTPTDKRSADMADIRRLLSLKPSKSITDDDINVKLSLYLYVENQYSNSLLRIDCFLSPVSHIYNNVVLFFSKKSSTILKTVSLTFKSRGDFLLFTFAIIK